MRHQQLSRHTNPPPLSPCCRQVRRGPAAYHVPRHNPLYADLLAATGEEEDVGAVDEEVDEEVEEMESDHRRPVPVPAAVPVGVDESGQPLDRSGVNSWSRRLGQVSPM